MLSKFSFWGENTVSVQIVFGATVYTQIVFSLLQSLMQMTTQTRVHLTTLSDPNCMTLVSEHTQTREACTHIGFIKVCNTNAHLLSDIHLLSVSHFNLPREHLKFLIKARMTIRPDNVL